MKVALKWGRRNTSGTYSVRGDGLEAAFKEMAKREEWGLFEGDLAFSYRADRDGSVTSVDLAPTFSITLPKWASYGKQPKVCKDEWDRMWKALREHEDGHRELFEEGIAKLEKALQALQSATKADVTSLVEDALAEIQSAHDRYDAKTKNGKSQGVMLTIHDECRARK